MPITKARKEAALADLKRTFAAFPTAIFTDFRGVNVGGITELRAKLRAQGARYLVAKRTLTELALGESAADVRDQLLAGATGICFAGVEPIDVAQVLVGFRKDFTTFTLKGALVEGRFLTPAQLGELARTPPRPVLLARLFGAMKGPHRNLVGVMHGVLRQFVGTLQAIADKKAENQPN